MIAFLEFCLECECTVAKNANVHVIIPRLADGECRPEGDECCSDSPAARLRIGGDGCLDVGDAPAACHGVAYGVDDGGVGSLQVPFERDAFSVNL